MPPPGRPMTARLRVRGWLQLVGPMHVGGIDHDPNGPLEVAVDGLDRLYVPGTSLAGALRSWAGPGQDDRWGYVAPKTTAGRASRVVVYDALVTSSTQLDSDEVPADCTAASMLDLRSGVGIDRFTGAAAAGILYERSVLPAGLFLRFELAIEATAQTLESDREHLARLLTALAQGRIRTGASKTRGMGQVKLVEDNLSILEERLDSRAGLVAVLRGHPRAWSLAELRKAHATAATQRPSTLSAVITWVPVAPVMARASIGGVAVDSIPLVTAAGADRVRLVLPGGSIKGSLRSHAERIVRTVRHIDLVLPRGGVAERAAAFRQQHAALPIVNALFGSAAETAGTNPESAADPGGVGSVTVDDCVSTTSIARETWERLATDAESTSNDKGAQLPDDLRDELADLGIETADHVAIDRWTGGAADGRLYRVLEPRRVAWEPMRIELDMRRLESNEQVPADAATALLLLVLRDCRAGRVTFGYGTNRGLGDISVTDLTVRSPSWPDGLDLNTALRSDHARQLEAAWHRYLSPLVEGQLS